MKLTFDIESVEDALELQRVLKVLMSGTEEGPTKLLAEPEAPVKVEGLSEEEEEEEEE
ncbi:TPA: hypothetical protein LEN38_001573, partial [Listeria monocytogenes]|nr:hypothetical protein [Listeria monocytogenes]